MVGFSSSWTAPTSGGLTHGGRSVSAAQPKPPAAGRVQRVLQGRWRQYPRINPDKARDMAQSTTTRLEKGFGRDVRHARSSIGGPQVRADRSQINVQATDVEADQCRKCITRAENRIKEWMPIARRRLLCSPRPRTGSRDWSKQSRGHLRRWCSRIRRSGVVTPSNS